jgi:uncharacterized membrane protein
MKTENVVLMKQAREALKGKWGLAIGVVLVYMVFAIGCSFVSIAGPIASLLLTGPLVLGLAIFVLSLSRNQNPRFEQMFEGFNRFGTALGTYLLVALFVILWCLLLIVPGIIAALSYSMTFFILADDNSVRAMEAIDRSKKMMFGYKAKLFRLSLRFLGWALLCILTLGIGLLWLIPYMQVTMAKFYDDVKANAAVTTQA